MFILYSHDFVLQTGVLLFQLSIDILTSRESCFSLRNDMAYLEYSVIALNVNGLNNPIKRSKIIAKMKREKQDLICWHHGSRCVDMCCGLEYKFAFLSGLHKQNKKYKTRSCVHKIHLKR